MRWPSVPQLPAPSTPNSSVVTVSATADEYINDHVDPRWQQRRGDESANLVDGMAAKLSSELRGHARRPLCITTDR